MTVIMAQYNKLVANYRKLPFAIITKARCVRNHSCLLAHPDEPERLIIDIACVWREKIARIRFY